MKKYLMGIILLLSYANLYSQRIVEKQIAISPTSSLNLKLEFADTIKIIQSKDNTVRIIASVNINDNLHNDKYELISSESNGTLKISAKIHDMKSLKVPCKNQNGSKYSYHDGECTTLDINYTVEIPAIANLQVETISGDITIEKGQSSMDIKSISGYIDLGLSEKLNSNLRIKSVTGGIYTNHEFNPSTDQFKGNPGGTDANFRLGTGEKSIKLSTISGDIFIRKI